MPMKNFELAVEEYQNVPEGEDKVLEFTLPVFRYDDEDGSPIPDGTRVYEAYVPTEDQIALYAGGLGGGVAAKQMAAVVTFMDGCFLPDSSAELLSRVQDRRDPLGMTAMQDVIQYLIEEATGNPSTGSATSTSSRPKSGTSSKDSSRPKAQTRSRGPRAGS